jgi:hypothetical protein
MMSYRGKMSEEEADKFEQMFGPGHVDQMVRHAIQTCWAALPKGKRTLSEVEGR